MIETIEIEQKEAVIAPTLEAESEFTPTRTNYPLKAYYLKPFIGPSEGNPKPQALNRIEIVSPVLATQPAEPNPKPQAFSSGTIETIYFK